MKPQRDTCPCGTPLTEEQKRRGGLYCGNACAGDFRPKKRATSGFNMTVPRQKDRKTVGPGFMKFVEGNRWEEGRGIS